MVWVSAVTTLYINSRDIFFRGVHWNFASFLEHRSTVTKSNSSCLLDTPIPASPCVPHFGEGQWRHTVTQGSVTSPSPWLSFSAVSHSSRKPCYKLRLNCLLDPPTSLHLCHPTQVEAITIPTSSLSFPPLFFLRILYTREWPLQTACDHVALSLYGCPPLTG